MASSDILSAFSSVLVENAKRYFDHAINEDAPLANGDVLPIEDTEGESYTFIAADRATSATTLVLDGGARPKPVARTPKKGTITPATVTTTLSFGRLAKLAKLSDGEMGQLLDFKLETAASDCASTLERGLHGWSVNPQAAATWTGTGGTDTVSVDFEDITGFEPNMLADFLDVSASKSYRVRVTGVTAAAKGAFSAKVAGTVAFKNDVNNPDGTGTAALTNTAVATGDSFVPAGYAAGFGGALTKVTDLISFDDICGSGATASLHGIATTDVASWTGFRDNIGAPITQEASLAFMGFLWQRGGKKGYPDTAICGPQVFAAHAAAAGIRGTAFGHMSAPAVDASVERGIDTKMDKYGNLSTARFEINGAKACVSPLAPATKLRFCQSKYTRLFRWTEIEPEEDGNGRPYHIDTDNVGVLVFMSGDIQLGTERRPSVGEIYGITSL
jgi:hypothetical protein